MNPSNAKVLSSGDVGETRLRSVSRCRHSIGRQRALLNPFLDPLGYTGGGIYGLLTNSQTACTPLVEQFGACVGKGSGFLLIMDKADTEAAYWYPAC